MVPPGPPPLTWRLDPHRDGWTGIRPGADVEGDVIPAYVIEARIVLRADMPRRPYFGRTRSGWKLGYETLQLTREAMDDVWVRSSPKPTAQELAMWLPSEQRKRRGRTLRNEPGERPPHPGALRRPPS